MKSGEYEIKNIYQGGYSSLDPNSAGYSNSFTGYRTRAGDLGLTTDPRSANIIKETTAKLSSGVKQMELALVSPEIFDSIPKQHLKEVKQLGKLTGVEMSIHAPVIDSAGITQQGWSEINRQASEKKIAEMIQRSHEIDSKGNMPVVFHSAEGIAGSEWEKMGPEGKRIPKRIIAVNKDTGEMTRIETDIRHYPISEKLKSGVIEKFRKGEITEEEIERNRKKYYREVSLEKGEVYSAEENLNTQNATVWDNQISQVLFNKERADEILQQNKTQIQGALKFINEHPKIRQNERLFREILDKHPDVKQALNHYDNATEYLDDTRQHLNAFFNKAYKYGDEKQRKALTKLRDEYLEILNGKGGNVFGHSEAMQKLIRGLKREDMAPRIFVPIEEFATEQSSKTFGSAAFQAYKKFGSKAPVVVIENPPAGFALSTGEDLKNLVVKSREQFVKNARKEGMNKSEAERAAEKLIGATWDVGHINMLRKQGFGKKEILEETEKIAPFVKHVHLSDNFGFEHTELPMGMGNVPIKEIMGKLGKEGFEARKIIEAGNWWQHFQTSPFAESLEGLGSPMYLTPTPVQPYWNQRTGLYQGYLGGLEGSWLPTTHYESFGAGFSQMPTELGGQKPGAQGSRMSGRGME